MSALHLVPRSLPGTWIDMSTVTPNNLEGKSLEAIRSMRVPCGGSRMPLGQLFRISGRDRAVIRIGAATPELVRIGADMRDGEIHVDGHAGPYLGARMVGGTIRLSGQASDYAGAGMQGGLIHIDGNSGNFTGAALPGTASGMSGGTLIVERDAGDRLGDRMRRGTIIVMGDSGSWAGSRMVAGTLVIMGEATGRVAPGMRRGTIVLGHGPSDKLANFSGCGLLKMAILRVLFKELAGIGGRLSGFGRIGPEAYRFAGDTSIGGKGEILVLARGSRS